MRRRFSSALVPSLDKGNVPIDMIMSHYLPRKCRCFDPIITSALFFTEHRHYPALPFSDERARPAETGGGGLETPYSRGPQECQRL